MRCHNELNSHRAGTGAGAGTGDRAIERFVWGSWRQCKGGFVDANHLHVDDGEVLFTAADPVGPTVVRASIMCTRGTGAYGARGGAV